MTRALDRYIFFQLATASLAITAVLVIAAVLTNSLTLFKKVVSGDLALGTFFDFIFLLMPSMVAVILPISVFAATLFVYEKLSSDSELVILRATGVSTFRISMSHVAAFSKSYQRAAQDVAILIDESGKFPLHRNQEPQN